MRLVKMPRLGQDMQQGTLVEWLKSVGDKVEEGDLLAVIETEKAEVEFEAPAGGYLVGALLEPGTTAPTGAPIAWISDDPAARPPVAESAPVQVERVLEKGGPSAAPEKISPSQPPAPRRARRKPVSPLARRRAAELGVDLEEVEGTGPGARVTESDVMRAHRAAEAEGPGLDRLSRMRLAVADSMTKSAAIPQFQLVREMVIERPEGGPNYTDLLLWATAQALAETPLVNSSWVEGDPPSIRSHPTVNLGFAVVCSKTG